VLPMNPTARYMRRGEALLGRHVDRYDDPRLGWRVAFRAMMPLVHDWRRAWLGVIAVLALMLVVASCTDSGSGPVTQSARGTVSPEPQHSGATGRPSTQPVTTASLRTHLLSVSDLPSGWVPSAVGRGIVAGTFDLCHNALPGGLLGPVSVGFQAAKDSSPIVGEQVVSFPNSDQAQSIAAIEQHGAGQCGQFTSDHEVFRVSPLQFPSVGQYSFALRLSSHVGSLYLVVVEVGRNLAHIALGTRNPSKELLLVTAKRAVRRLESPGN
jgi:hypothetical protein